jgi:hypothetical protein
VKLILACHSMRCGTPEQVQINDAMGYALHRSRSDDNKGCNGIETHEHKGDFKE